MPLREENCASEVALSIPFGPRLVAETTWLVAGSSPLMVIELIVPFPTTPGSPPLALLGASQGINCPVRDPARDSVRPGEPGEPVSVRPMVREIGALIGPENDGPEECCFQGCRGGLESRR